MSVYLAVALIIIVYLLFRVVSLESRVKQLQSKLKLMKNQPVASEVDHELRDLIKEGKDIKAVKEAREVLGLSLLEGKEYIDRLKQSMN
ncbi:hypothetical protein [Oceanobacillus sp. FSL H7-0719]|uniref:hypothetical protein n=1 Tax=Oceanobacillus sp. FSL H7-0719 TaxID=2954507 RepID=UPI0032479769